MIYKFQPFSTTKDLGKEYNAHCSIVPNDDDWILILDYDTCIINPVTYQVVENAIARYPDTQIFGAMTNRVGYDRQRLQLEMDDNFDMLYHYNKAAERAVRFPDECFNVRGLAGFFMLFRKRYWNRHPFQEDIVNHDGTTFDYHFERHADIKRVIKGAYVFHGYRIWRGNNYMGTNHLKKQHGCY